METFLTDAHWKTLLEEEFKKPYFKELKAFLNKEAAEGKEIFPPKKHIFEALNLTPFDKVKVVIIGQDPYHGKGQAHGLSFSVRAGVRIPPSLQNIFKELQQDLGIAIPKNGDLSNWAREGVLLLNNVLTVEEGKAGSHHGQGWEIFTDKIIELLNEKREHLVFILWGSPAQKKASKVDPKKHLILKSVHPSPLSSYRGFFGSQPFSQTNEYLTKTANHRKIEWSPT
jgi:uracil-DNA glycosylase